MKHHGIYTILIPIMISFLEPERSSVAACNISEVDAPKHHQLFKDLIQEGNVQLVYINISSSSFQNISLSEKEWNRVVDWIWVTNEYKHFLSYPIDIDIFTLGLMKDNDRSLRLNISIDDVSECINQTLWIQVFEYLLKTNNVSDGYLCHRYFENQDWKLTLFEISHASIGYGFHCYQNNNTALPVIVEKSAVIYITIAIILLLFSFYPLIVSKSSHEATVGRQLRVYTEADYPYTPRRMLLNIMFKTGEMLHTEHVTRRQKRAMNFFSGARLSLLITIVTGFVFFAKIIFIRKCTSCLPPNAHIYKEIYVTDGIVDGSMSDYILPILLSTFFSFIFLVSFNNYILLISEFEDEILVVDFLSFKFIRSIPVSYFLKNNEKSGSITTQVVHRFFMICSLSFWCKIYLIPLTNASKYTCLFCFKVLFSPIIFLLNVLLIIVFSAIPTFNQIYCLNLSYVVFFFPKCLKGYAKNHVFALLIAIAFTYLLLEYGSVIYIGMSFGVQFLIYFIIVGIPHFYSTQLHIFLFLTAMLSYMSKFFLEFFQLYRLLLKKIIELKRAKEISIADFDAVVSHCCPLKTELFFLFAKLVLTSSLLVIMYLTLSEVNFLDSQNSFDLNSFFMYVFVLLTPGILEILFFENNADKVERMHYELDEQVRLLINVQDSEENEQNIQDRNDEGGQEELEDDDCCCDITSWCKLLCLCFCGCFESPYDRNGKCRYCYSLKEVLDENNYPSYQQIHFDLCNRQMNHQEEYTPIAQVL